MNNVDHRSDEPDIIATASLDTPARVLQIDVDGLKSTFPWIVRDECHIDDRFKTDLEAIVDLDVFSSLKADALQQACGAKSSDQLPKDQSLFRHSCPEQLF